jgi:flagellar L-ring protein precursor FlgH
MNTRTAFHGLTFHKSRFAQHNALNALRSALFAVAALAMTGCSHFVHKPVVAQMPPVEIPAPPPPVPNGAIFQAASYGNRPLFEDQRPRMPGDVLTVVFNEQVSASKNAQASASRKSESSFDPTIVPNGLKDLGKLGIDLKGGHDFQGSGGAKANNTFTGTITVTVMQVLNNGNLRVHGEKQIAINQGTEYIRFAGTVDPRTISADNSVLSTRVADARIEYVGDGYINDAQRMGWLQRVMMKVSPF